MVRRAELPVRGVPESVRVARNARHRDARPQQAGNVSFGLRGEIIACDLGYGGVTERAPGRGAWAVGGQHGGAAEE